MKCILCGNTKYNIISNNLRFDITRKVIQCSKCLLTSLEDPTKNDVDYSKKYREKYSPVLEKSLNAKDFFEFSLPIFIKRVSRIKHLLSKEKEILEIGCSTGHFLECIKQDVSKCVGIELDLNYAKFAREHCNLEIHTTPLEKSSLSLKQFDVIFLFQVLEHIAEPLKFLELCKKYLKPNGVIYVEVPNVDDILISIYNVKSFKKFYFREPHSYYYSVKTLEKLMTKAGFKGKSFSIQEYSVFNHINWILNGTPQSDQHSGYQTLKWDVDEIKNIKENEILRKWFERKNEEYKEILENSNLGEHAGFEGTI